MVISLWFDRGFDIAFCFIIPRLVLRLIDCACIQATRFNLIFFQYNTVNYDSAKNKALESSSSN